MQTASLSDDQYLLVRDWPTKMSWYENILLLSWITSMRMSARDRHNISFRSSILKINPRRVTRLTLTVRGRHHIAHLCSYLQDAGGIVENAVRSDLLLTWVIGRQPFAPNLPREYKSPDNGTAAEWNGLQHNFTTRFFIKQGIGKRQSSDEKMPLRLYRSDPSFVVTRIYLVVWRPAPAAPVNLRLVLSIAS